jgi:hypothetical protein
MLATPLALLGTIALVYSLLSWASHPERALPLPIAGSGVILLTSAFILVCGGALGELIYKLGDVREHEFARLTERLWSAPSKRS